MRNFDEKMEDEACNLIREMALNNYRWPNEQTPPKRPKGKFDVDALTLLTIKFDTMTQRLDSLNVKIINAHAPIPTCDSCGSCDHMTLNSQVRNPFHPNL